MRPEIADVQLHYVITRRGTTSVLADGLLAAAYRAGVRRIAVELVRGPTEANGRAAVCAATAVTPSARAASAPIVVLLPRSAPPSPPPPPRSASPRAPPRAAAGRRGPPGAGAAQVAALRARAGARAAPVEALLAALTGGPSGQRAARPRPQLP